MKKKGRIAGTIGWILAFALVGGTFVYSTRFEQKSYAKTQKFVSKTEGSPISVDSDKKKSFSLINGVVYDAYLGAFGSAGGITEPISYTNVGGEKFSYTLDFSVSYATKTNLNGTQTMDIATVEGRIFSDESSTLTFVSFEETQNRTYGKTADIACLHDKTTDSFVYTELDPYFANSKDVYYLDKAEWSDFSSIAPAYVASVRSVFASVLSVFNQAATENPDAPVKNYPLYGYELNVKNTAEQTVDCTYTTGFYPEIRLNITDKTESMTNVAKIVFRFSNLGNTKVVLPEKAKTTEVK